MKQNFALCIIELKDASSWPRVCARARACYRGLSEPFILISTAEVYYVA